MLSIKLAYRNILRHRRRTILTGLSMTGGFVLCTFSFSMLEGSWGNAVDIFTLDHTGHIQIHQSDYHRHPKIHKAINDPGAVARILAASDQVSGYAPRVYAPALAYAGDQTAPVSVIGVDPVLEPTTSRLKQKVREGSYFEALSSDAEYAPAMIGISVARTLNIGIGDEIVLISQGADGSIANDIFRVSATVGNKTSYDRFGVYVPLTAAQSFLSLDDRVHEFAILVDSPSNNESIAFNLARRAAEIDPALSVLPWQTIEATFYRTMQADKQSNHFMMVIIIFLVFIGVLNTVLMSILERTREFGVIRAIGCRPVEIVKLVFLETTIMATLSIAVGLIVLIPLLYWLITVGFTMPEPVDVGGVMFDQMTGSLSVFVLLVPALLIFGFSALVSIPPGIRAASITPRQALASH